MLKISINRLVEDRELSSVKVALDDRHQNQLLVRMNEENLRTK